MTPAEQIEARLPKGPWVSSMDAAIAFDVSRPTVDGWREKGEFYGKCMNKGSGSKLARWFIQREALIEFAKRRTG